jgi:hypothetical protein
MSTEPLWVVGGEQRVAFSNEPEWHKYKQALVVRVDDGRAKTALEYVSPPKHCPDDRPPHVFKAATFGEDTAWLCTTTEVLICDLPSFDIRKVISLPCFNDLHHVTPGPNGNLFVAVTGLDAVAEVTPDGELVRITDVLTGGTPWHRFSSEVDYRKVQTTKPHRSHPNFVFFLEGRPWVTRFAQRDAVALDGLGRPDDRQERRLSVELQGVHDGHVVDGHVWFTTVDGRLVSFDVATGEKRVLKLDGAPPGDDRPLGWCRGLLPRSGQAWVGFTRIRYTKLRQNLSWIRHGFRWAEAHRFRPTRIALYDLEAGRNGSGPAPLREVDLEPAGLGAVFGIYPAR